MLIQTRVGESDQSGSGNARITGNTRCFTTIILTLLSSSQCNAMARPSTFQPCNFQSQYPQSHCAIFPVSALLRSLTNPHQVWHLLRANFGGKPMGGGDHFQIWNLPILTSVALTGVNSGNLWIPLQIDCGYDRGLMGRYLTIQSTERWILVFKTITILK